MNPLIGSVNPYSLVHDCACDKQHCSCSK